MKTNNFNIPENSILNSFSQKYNYVDSYSGYIRSNFYSIEDIGKAFFTSAPTWVDKLFEFRNKLVSFWGLKTSGNVSNRSQLLQDFRCEPGEQLGLFKVYSKTPHEVIFGQDDKHLDFRVSLLKTDNNILYLTTVVQFHNWFGKFYFIPVKFFHKLISPIMLKSIINKLEIN